MEMKNLGKIVATLSFVLLSTGAMASETAKQATGPGPGAGNPEAGTPIGKESCYYVYSIQKIGNSLATIGETMDYHVFVQNLGSCRLKYIDLEDRLPEGVQYVSAYPAPSWVQGHRIQWKNFEIQGGRYIDFVITTKVENSCQKNQSVTNTACAYTPWIGTQICDSQSTFIY
jgi:uncharacterized repeat protein (TIGR01451 family)